MADRPCIEGPKLPGLTEAMPNRVVAAATESGAHMSVEEASASTQMGMQTPPVAFGASNTAVGPGPGLANKTRVMPPQAPGVSTDLGASRDMTPSSPGAAPAQKKNVGMLVALAGGALVVGVIAAVAFKGSATKATGTGTPTASTAAITATPTEAPTNITAPPSSVASPTPSASVAASASAPTTPPVTSTKPPVGPTKQPSSKPIPGVGAGTIE